MSDSPMVVLTTCPAESAGAIARQIVSERLAACCNRLPGVESVYWWQGALETSHEDLLVFKTTAARMPALTRRLVALHPYDLPEVVGLPVTAGFEPYAPWIAREVDGIPPSALDSARQPPSMDPGADG